MLSFLLGAVIGTFLGFAIIGIFECIKLAARIFETEPVIDSVKFLKKDSEVYRSIMKRSPRIRAAMEGEEGRLVAIRYRDGRVKDVTSIDKGLSSDFDNCSGYQVNQDNPDEAIRIR